MKRSYSTILSVLAILAVLGLGTATYAQQQRVGGGGYNQRQQRTNQGSPNVFDNQDNIGQTGTGIISRRDPNGGYGGYNPGMGPGSPCVGCGPVGGQGPTRGGYYPGNRQGRYQVPPTTSAPAPVNNVSVNNTYNQKFYRPMLQEVELQATGTGFGILRDYFAAKFATSGQRKLQNEAFAQQQQLLMMQMSQQRDTYRESNTRTERYERDDRRVESEAPPERWMDVHVSNSCEFAVQLAVNGEVVKSLGSRHAVSIPVPVGGQLTVLRMDGSVLRQYSHPGSEVVIQ